MCLLRMLPCLQLRLLLRLLLHLLLRQLLRTPLCLQLRLAPAAAPAVASAAAPAAAHVTVPAAAHVNATLVSMRGLRSFWVNVWAQKARRRRKASQILRTPIFLSTSCIACFIMILVQT